MKEQYDAKNGYCRMLGHTLSFSYCRAMNSGLPCYNILNCWFERFDIETFVTENYSVEELQDVFKPPKMKIATMVEVVKKVTGSEPVADTDGEQKAPDSDKD